MACVVSLLARKGGSGRTTLTINLAAAFAAGGLRVVVVDLDNQASLTQFFLGPDATAGLLPEQTVVAAFQGLSAPVHPTRFEGVSLVPAHFDMAPESHQRLDLRAIDADLVLVDCPPKTDQVETRAALASSDYVLSPVVPEMFGTQAVGSMAGLLRQAAHAGNPGIRLLGFVINMRGRRRLHAAAVDVIRAAQGERVLDVEVPDLAAYSDSQAEGCSVLDYRPAGKRAAETIERAAAVIRALAEEVVARITSREGRAVA